MRWQLALLLCLPGCATIVHGSSQNLTVTTNPAGASCRLEREGVAIGVVTPTPGTLRIDKSKNDIVATCTRDGHDPTTVRHASEFGGTTVGNAVLGGLIGVAVDAVSGANFPYPPELVMNLQVTGGPPVVQPERPKQQAAVGSGGIGTTLSPGAPTGTPTGAPTGATDPAPGAAPVPVAKP